MATLIMQSRNDTEPCGGAIKNALAKVGSGLKYEKISFGKGVYPVDIPLIVNTGATVSCEEGAILKLIDNAPVGTWASMVPVFGQAGETISDVVFENLTFDGNSAKQNVSAGKGYNNFIWMQDATNITARNLKVKNTKGDVLRVTNGTKIRYYDNEVYHCGHDGLYVDGGSDIEAWGNKTTIRTNSALRLRGVTGAGLHDNEIYCDLGWEASSPGFQIENPSGGRSSDIVIQRNLVKGTNGPAVWAIGLGNGGPSVANGLEIKNNLFIDCGNMGADIGVHGVGGVVADGWDILVENNTFEGCHGYGVMFGNYRGKSLGSGFQAVVRKNIFTNTSPANTVGVSSGAAVANLVGDRYSVICEENCFSGNTSNLYAVESTGDILADPLYADAFKGGYHLQDKSPCVFAEYEIGRYSDTVRKIDPSMLPSVVIPKLTKEELLAYVQMLRDAGYVRDTDKISYLNMGE